MRCSMPMTEPRAPRRSRSATGLGAVLLIVPGLLLVIPQPASASDGQAPERSAESARPWTCPSGLPPDVTCGRFDLPLDWANPTSPRSVSLAFAVHRAPGERIGTLTFNPGGPGQSGIDALGFMLGAGPPAMALPQQVVEHFDIVAWDPRGVGYSGPAMEGCERDQVTMGPIPQIGPIDWDEVARGYHRQLKEVLRRCADANPEVAAHLGTSQVIEDLEALRQELTVDQWTYLGVSYGTTIGMAYARAHPDRIRALVLDGVAPPSESLLQAASSQAPAWRAALASFARVYPKAGALTHPVLDALDEQVLSWHGAPFGRFSQQDSVSSLYESLRSFLPSEARFPRLRDLFVDLAAEIPEEVSDPPRPPDSTIEIPMNPIVSLVLCADRSKHPSIAQAADLARSAERTGITVAGISILERTLWCAGLGSYGRPLDTSTAPLVLPNAALIVNATGDIKTPMKRAKVAAGQIPGSRLISYLGTTHGLYPRAGSACVNDAVTDYLVNLRLPADNLTCPIAGP